MFKMSDYQGAIIEYTNILKQKLSESFEVYYRRGWAKAEYGKYDETIIDFSKSISLFPSHSDSYLHKGFCEVQLEIYKEAISDFTQVIKLHPKDKEGYFHRKVN